MTISTTTTWRCDTPFCHRYVTVNATATYEQIAERLDGWTLDNERGVDRCDRCNRGHCPGVTGGRDRYGELCPCVHPIGHDGACQCKHHLARVVR
jgi:hypothetical protein